MKSKPKIFRILIGVCVVIAALQCQGQLTKVLDYKLHQPEDRGVLFTTVLTHDHSLLTLVARKDGTWLLTKVQGWWEPHPVETQLRIRAFSRRDNVEFAKQNALFPTKDGKFVVSLICAMMKGPRNDPYPTEMFLTVIRLEPFQVVASVRAKQLGMKGYLNGFLDPSGHVIVSSSIFPVAQDAATTPLVTYYRLGLPDLHLEGKCNYSSRLSDKIDAAAFDKSCGGFAEEGGYSSASQMDVAARSDTGPSFLGNWRIQDEGKGVWLGTSANSERIAILDKNRRPVREYEPQSMCAKQRVHGPAWICDCNLVGGAPDSAIIECNTSHDNWLGLSVELRQWVADVDIKNRRDLFALNIPIRDNFDAKLVNIGAERFLLIVLNGSKLQVYTVSTTP